MSKLGSSSATHRITWSSKAAWTIGLMVPLLTICAYAGLIPLGQWQPDEYETFDAFRQRGLPFLWLRTAYWSPRPLSEGALFLYGKLIEATGRQLIVPVLGCLWTVFLLACFAPAIAIRRRSGRPILPALTMAATMTALFLGGHEVAEVFYWPQGAIAYMPTLAAIALLLGISAFAERGSSRVRWIGGAALLVATLTSEVGAFFTVVFGLGSLTANVGWRVWKREPRPFRAAELQYAIPLLTGLAVVTLIANGRMGNETEIFGDAAIAHRLVPSFLATLIRFPAEFALGSGAMPPDSLVLGLIARIAFAVGSFALFCRLALRADEASIIRLCMIALAATAAAFISLLGAFHQFGTVCCERHETMRECLVVIAIVAAAAVAAQFRMRQRSDKTASPARRPNGLTTSSWLAPALLTASVILTNLWTYPLVYADYQRFTVMRLAKASNWSSGRSDGSDMIFDLGEQGHLTGKYHWPVGSFEQGRDAPQNVGKLLRFFGKEGVTLRPSDG